MRWDKGWQNGTRYARQQSPVAIKVYRKDDRGYQSEIASVFISHIASPRCKHETLKALGGRCRHESSPNLPKISESLLIGLKTPQL